MKELYICQYFERHGLSSSRSYKWLSFVSPWRRKAVPSKYWQIYSSFTVESAFLFSVYLHLQSWLDPLLGSGASTLLRWSPLTQFKVLMISHQMFKLKMRLGQILHFIIRIYPLESHFYGFVKQSKIFQHTCVIPYAIYPPPNIEATNAN